MEQEGFTPIPKNLQFRVGLLLGLTFMVAAGFILYALYARGVFEATQRLTLVSDNAEGVSLGMDLSFSGFPIGRVDRESNRRSSCLASLFFAKSNTSCGLIPPPNLSS